LFFGFSPSPARIAVIVGGGRVGRQFKHSIE
jgi:hypothetical protein